MRLRMIMILLTIVSLSADIAMAQAILTEFTGTSVLTAFLAPGTVQCPGGEPTAGPVPCSPGSRAHVRDLVFEQNHVATDARMTGRLVVVMNANTDGWTPFGPGSGPMWGTIRLEVAGGGVWEGSWTGDRKVTSDGASSSVRGVMNGTGGDIEGLKVEFAIAFAPPLAFAGTSSGRILAPGGK